LRATGYADLVMSAIISLLRGINLGGHRKIKMDELRILYETLGLEEPKTFIQSGNVVFRSKERNLTRLAKRIEEAIERKFGFRADVILRTASEMKEVVRKNPFAKRRDIVPSKLLVTFLANNLPTEVQEKLGKIEADPEEVRTERCEIYIYFPDGMGRSKLTPVIGRILQNTGTGRNWNTVIKLLEMAEKLEAAE
jgi:uncharacterized protein (DUF1697 family)